MYYLYNTYLYIINVTSNEITFVTYITYIVTFVTYIASNKPMYMEAHVINAAHYFAVFLL